MVTNISTIKKILVVENNRIIALDLRKTCEKLGHVCAYIAYSNEAIKRIKEINPHLVLMDIEFDKNKNLIDESEKICDEFELPIIFFTTAPTGLYKDHRLKSRCEFQSIPYTKEDLVEAIETLLEKYEYP